jgi:hypothetical protein
LGGYDIQPHAKVEVSVLQERILPGHETGAGKGRPLLILIAEIRKGRSLHEEGSFNLKDKVE